MEGGLKRRRYMYTYAYSTEDLVMTYLEYPELEMAIHLSMLAWRIPWTE